MKCETCQREYKEHWLKIWPQYFNPVLDGTKTFEVREDDREFKVGDTVWIREINPAVLDETQYTGRALRARIVYKLSGVAGLTPGYCVLGLGSVFDIEGEGHHPVRYMSSQP